ncbi:glycosyltransferase [Rufibacter aurantiacus]|uniref:glycosyltransferase n=1 Tax=Rufibacter aurantiacus TaxID=2817374 RepID=UPI001B30AD9F|nr:glycosyltransferase [Rufibacter aurantiacus]
MTKKRHTLAFIIPSLTIGGAELQTINQINYIVNHNLFDIRLLILSNKVPLYEQIKLQRDHIKILNENSSTTIDKLFFKKLPYILTQTVTFLRDHQVTDILAILPMSQFISRLAKGTNNLLGRNISLSSYYRDVEYKTTPLDTIFKKTFNALNSGLAFLFDNRSLFISNAVHEDIKQNIYVRRSLVLPNSLPLNQVNSDEGKYFLAANGISEENFIILIPGRLHPKKGHNVFIEAFKVILESNKLNKIKVIIAGDGPSRLEIENKISEYNLEKYFYINGFTENKLLLSLYKCANLVVIPSIYEGFGNVAIEGLMQQSLMLVSNTGGLGEIISDGINGFTFQCGNSIDLSKKLLFIYENKHKVLIEKSVMLNDFKSNYTIESQLKKIFKFLNLNLK